MNSKNPRISKLSPAEPESVNFFTNPLLSQMSRRPFTSKSSCRLLLTQGSSRTKLTTAHRILSTAVSVHRTQPGPTSLHHELLRDRRPGSREHSAHRKVPAQTAKEFPSAQAARPSSRVMKGLTEKAKPTLVLEKHVRKDPFAHSQSAPFRKILECGLYDMINAGHIPRSFDVKPFFSDLPEWRSPSKDQSREDRGPSR